MKKTSTIITALLLAVVIAAAGLLLPGCQGSSDSKESAQRIGFGEWKNDSYANDFVDVKFNLPDGWQYMTKEELAELMNISLEHSEDEADALETLARCNIMLAYNEDNTETIQIMAENLSVSGYMEMTVEEYLNARTDELDAYYSERNTTHEISKFETIKIGKHEYIAVTVTLPDTTNGVVQFHAVRRSGNYMINVMINVSDSAELEAVTTCFE